MVDTADKNYQHGSNSVDFGPRSQKCQLYMAERCAKKWDGFCEFFYREHNNTSFQRNQPYPNCNINQSYLGSYGLNPQLTTGQQLLSNTAQLKYCDFANCQAKYEPFDPMNPNSPMISYYVDGALGENCIPICNKINVAELDNDPVLNRLIADPMAGGATLINMCNTAQREGIDLNNTKLGVVCRNYHQNMNMLQKQ
jgi:hypothetical protein